MGRGTEGGVSDEAWVRFAAKQTESEREDDTSRGLVGGEDIGWEGGEG